MKMKFPDGVTHHYDETGQRHEVSADRVLEVPDSEVPQYLAAGYTKVGDETTTEAVVEEPVAEVIEEPVVEVIEEPVAAEEQPAE